MAALCTVFNVNELVETILLQLPLYDLLLATVVCEHWRQIISTSPAIRARLLEDRIPSFTLFQPSLPESDDLCNASKEGPWFFRTPVPNGIVIVLKTANQNIQFFVPNDLKQAVRSLDAKRTRGAFHVNYKIRRGWANFYDADGGLVRRKTTSTSPWSLPVEKPESLWDFVRKFNAEENWRYRMWIEKCARGRTGTSCSRYDKTKGIGYDAGRKATINETVLANGCPATNHNARHFHRICDLLQK